MAQKRVSLALLLIAGCSAQPVAPSATAARPVDPAASACAASLAGAPAGHGPELDPAAIRVVNWNIQKGGDPAWADDLEAVDSEADLMILQEASPALESLGSVATRHHLAFAEGYKGMNLQTGVMTLSRALPLAECDLTAREPWLGTRKATLVTEYGLDGTEQTLLVLNIHGVNFSIGARELAAQIDSAAEIIAAHDGPVLFSGDFNTWRAGRARLLDDAAERLGLNAPQYDDDHRKRFLGFPLDHIYTRGLVAVSATSHDVSSSDHNPMYVEFRLESDALAGRAIP
jgi:endonuclease/exonuclease/phosphatase (EEP) superfamily protein YafD